MTPHILVVDDEADIRQLLQDILEDEGFRVSGAAHSEEAELVLKKHHNDIHLIILDIWLENSDKDGLELLKDIKDTHSDVPILMISGHGNIETAVQTIKDGAYDFVEKPFKTDRLLLTINRALELTELRKENRALKTNNPKNNFDLINRSDAMTQLNYALKRIAPSDSRVFITGEAGTGKDMLARIIHNASKRADKPYLALNCATLTPNRLEAELFGEERAGEDKAAKEGLLAQANGGTLFLDQIADMPIETQGKIVRVLQEQKFRPVGSTETLKVDVRIITASSKDITKLIDRGDFREDLYYRLNVMPITMPSLKDRIEDIPQLAEYFMNKCATTEGLKAKKLNKDVLTKLQHTHWPGNVRQLKNVIEWMLIMHAHIEQDSLGLEHLPPEMREGEPIGANDDHASIVSHASDKAKVLALPLREARHVFEKEYLISQVSKFNGNISKTADFIGMERSALHRKLKSLGLDQNNNKDISQA